MKILVADDEPLARQRLTALVHELEVGEVIAEVGFGKDVVEIVARQHPHVVLLDIRMPDIDGLRVAKQLRDMTPPPAVVFTTAYDTHALAAFETQALDYLLKPIRRERLAAALARAKHYAQIARSTELQTPAAPRVGRTHIHAPMHGSIRIVPVAHVRYFRAEHKYVTVRFPKGQLLIEASLTALEEEFGDRFLRAHRNALVALAHIQALELDAAGRPSLRCHGIEDQVTVSRRLLRHVKARLKGGSGGALR